MWFRLRAEARTRWPAWLGLAVLVGVAGGALIAVTAGARRTESAFDRFVDARHAADAIIMNYADWPVAFDLDAIAALPIVADSATATWDFVLESPAIAPDDARLGVDIHSVRILEGRWPDPSRPDEVAVGFDVAAMHEWVVGSEFDPLGAGERRGLAALEELDVDRLTTAEQARLATLLGVEDEAELEVAVIEAQTYAAQARRAHPDAVLRVVGIVAGPTDFPPHSQGIPCCVYHSASYGDLGVQSGELLAVRLVNGEADLPALRRELDRYGGGVLDSAVLETQDQRAAVRESLHVQAVALRIVALVGGLVAFVMLAQLLTRFAWLEAGDHATLDALGATRRQRFVLGLGRAAAVGVAAAGVSVAVGVALSPLFPTGLARTAEPDPGLAVDAPVLVAGAMLTALAVVVAAIVPSWRAASVRRVRERDTTSTSSPPLRAPPGLRVPQWVGARLALQRGRGPAAVPVWSSVGVVALGVAALTGALVFGRSLDHLLATPRLYGVGWDLGVTANYLPDQRNASLAAVVADHPDVLGVAAGWLGDSATINGQTVGLASLDAVRGSALPPVVEGRPPLGPGEIALGSTTMQRLGARIGDRVEVTLPTGETAVRDVVGRAVLPAAELGLHLGEGALITYASSEDASSAATFDVDVAPLWYLDLRDGADPEAVFVELRDELCADRDPLEFCDLYFDRLGQPTELVDFGRVRETPLLLGGLLAVLGAGALAHVLVTSVHRHRRQLAVLRALGLGRRQLQATVHWLAWTLAMAACAAGVPLGIAVGRLLWRQRVNDLGDRVRAAAAAGSRHGHGGGDAGVGGGRGVGAGAAGRALVRRGQPALGVTVRRSLG